MENIFVAVVLLFVIFTLLHYLKEEKTKSKESTPSKTNEGEYSQQNEQEKNLKSDDLLDNGEEDNKSEESNGIIDTESIKDSNPQSIKDEISKCYDLVRFGNLEKNEFINRVLNIINNKNN